MRTLREMMDLSGRVALVTGGAGHLGRVIAQTLAELHAAVFVHDLDLDGAEDCVELLRRMHGATTFAMASDLSHPDCATHIITEVEKRLGGLDILVNNAAFVADGELPGWAVPLAEQGLEAWRACLEVNLTAPFALSQAAAPLLVSSGQGSIINIASIYGIVGPDWRLYEGTAIANPAAYAASKGGLVQLTRWLATTLAPGVRVNAIAAGGIMRAQESSFRDRYVLRTPLGRMATEEDFKGAVAYFAGDLSAYVTGQILAVDGGWLAW